MGTRLPGATPDQVNRKLTQLICVLNRRHGLYGFSAAEQCV
jgi:hypothetical protein